VDPAADTWPKLLAENYRRHGDRKKAMRHKRYGIWQAYTWADYYTEVKYLALGLLSLGFAPGEKLLIVGDAAPPWYCAELAAQANRGVAVGAYPDATPAELRYIAQTAEVRFAVVQDQEQVDKLLEIAGDLPLLEKIVFWNYKGLAQYRDPVLLGYREVLELGRSRAEQHPALFEQNVEAGRADDICAVVFTAGRTGSAPKPAVHTYRTIRAGSEGYLQLDPWTEWDDVVPDLPPAGITGHWTGVGCHLLARCVLDFAESPETQLRDAAEIGPSVVIHEARVWEGLAADVQARVLGVSGIKKLLFRWFLPAGQRRARGRLAGEVSSVGAMPLQALAHALLFRPIKKKLGLARARICYSTGGLLSPEALTFYHALGLPLKSVYGTTEGGVLAGAPSADTRLDTVGPPLPGREVRITDEGELTCRQAGTFLGYYNDPERTAAVLRDGWFHTGDLARAEQDGHLRVLGALESVVPVAGGGELAPAAVECRLRSSPYIRDAWVLVAPEAAHVAAVIVVNFRTASRWAGRQRLAFNTLAELSQLPEVYELVRQEIHRINEAMPSELRVRKFAVLHREFEPDEGETTRTRSLRRKILQERFQELTEAMYAGASEVSLVAAGGRSDSGSEAKRVVLTVANTGAVSP
jgi:long-chain acyl-CoA synthetase